jgi:hypothetical protein
MRSLGLDPKSDLAGADLRSADMRGEQLPGADLRAADLTGAVLSKANLEGANLIGASLRQAKLDGANMRGVKLVDASIADARLVAADLTGADLSACDLSGADLRGAVLRDANLTGADLSGASITGADLTGAHLDRVVGWPPANAPSAGTPTDRFSVPPQLLAPLIQLLRSFAVFQAIRGTAGLPSAIDGDAQADALAADLVREIERRMTKREAYAGVVRDLAILRWERGQTGDVDRLLTEAESDPKSATDAALLREISMVRVAIALTDGNAVLALQALKQAQITAKKGAAEALLMIATASAAERPIDAAPTKRSLDTLEGFLRDGLDPAMAMAVRALKTAIELKQGQIQGLLELLGAAKAVKHASTRRLLRSVEALLTERP